MKRSLYIKIAAVLLVFLSAGTGFSSGGIEKLENLDYRANSSLRSLRNDVKTAVFTIKSRRSDRNLPELKFYSYKVKEKENFWVVLSKCSMDMDTLMTVNGLTSPYQVVPGTVLYIPNMRGVVVRGEKRKEIYQVLASEKIDIRYVRTVNKSRNLDKKFIFIPCGKVSSVEKSLFMGTAFLSPVRGGRTTSGFGTRRDPFNSRRMEFHKGIDIGVAIGTKVRASRSGRVIFSGYKGGYGRLIILEHEFGYQTYYGHLSRSLVKPGDSVSPGQVIALSGNTGRSTGPHLHFEIRKNGRSMNPFTYIRRAHSVR
ncbi:MAG TPA: LysM peptidoglycan-binding domain-containing M23 family metallopeptidase [Spirochaetota bacterium]|nr:LysM peptidoglycan-binding domain-containing M23 family metallopeptidase [Spirochaetota bacterium]HPJ33745.1 LysM peptidoglycan-binding domain-containing M23 family metallopeptidase [Spirochaetota bacterium]